jgi:hypothetical protein
MSKRLPVPSDLEHLIEKRDDEKDRRNAERRKRAQYSTESVAGKKPERRKQVDRRKKGRRKSGS